MIRPFKNLMKAVTKGGRKNNMSAEMLDNLIKSTTAIQSEKHVTKLLPSPRMKQ